ncbi:unnamed protein product [Mortierella alpina]
MSRLPMLVSSSASSAPMGASLARLPGFLRQESSFSGTSDMHVRLFRDLNLEERQRAKSATDLDSPFSVLEAAHPTTRELNRYTDILPYKHSRIIINDAKDRSITTSYINANRITAPVLLRPSLPKDWPGYIATQAPLPHTQPRFWRMIQQQNVQVIVCLTAVNNDRTRRAQKAERYWPLVGETDEFDGNLSVRNLGPWRVQAALNTTNLKCGIRSLIPTLRGGELCWSIMQAGLTMACHQQRSPCGICCPESVHGRQSSRRSSNSVLGQQWFIAVQAAAEQGRFASWIPSCRCWNTPNIRTWRELPTRQTLMKTSLRLLARWQRH